MKAQSLMIQGTGSSVGKSLVVAALCRIFARRGRKVAPFKSQNMSLNSFITGEGHEMGRAQVVQAEAAGIRPSALMNPVLLKPSGDKTSQVIVNGEVRASMGASEYYAFRHTLKDDIMRSYRQLAETHDLIIIEGAGSPAEINLRENDLANMGMARMADAPVVLVGDIDRGGVFASLYGTIRLLEPDEQQRIQGVMINKFRGEAAILEPGLRQLEYIVGKPVLGVLPMLDVRIEEEDSLTERLARRPLGPPSPDDLDVAVIRLPRMSNFTDFAVFDLLPGVRLRYVDTPAGLGRPDLIILPGTKNTLQDMRHLHDSGLAGLILSLHAEGAPVIGICGGYQILGRVIRDPAGVESGLREVAGLGLLDCETIFETSKRTTQTRLTVEADCSALPLLRGTAGMRLDGYEIHMGQTLPLAGCRAFARAGDGAIEGALGRCGRVMGTYLHGVFDSFPFTCALLNNLREKRGLPPLAPPTDQLGHTYQEFREGEYEKLADAVEAALDMEALGRIIDGWQGLPG